MKKYYLSVILGAVTTSLFLLLVIFIKTTPKQTMAPFTATYKDKLPSKPNPNSPEAKIESNILDAINRLKKIDTNGKFTNDPSNLSSSLIHINSEGKIQIDIFLFNRTPDFDSKLSELGFISEIDATSIGTLGALEGWIPYDKILEIAKRPEVRIIRAPGYPLTD